MPTWKLKFLNLVLTTHYNLPQPMCPGVHLSEIPSQTQRIMAPTHILLPRPCSSAPADPNTSPDVLALPRGLLKGHNLCDRSKWAGVWFNVYPRVSLWRCLGHAARGVRPWEGATGEGATSVFQLEKELSHPVCGLQVIKAKQTKKKPPL